MSGVYTITEFFPQRLSPAYNFAKRPNLDMSQTYDDINITPSMLDRLLDLDPQAERESPKSRSANLRQLKASVRRDLEYLLNSRHAVPAGIETLEETSRSAAVYGLPDFTGQSIVTAADQKNLVQKLETAISIFEPRLVEVRITLEPVSQTDRALRFRIEARLKVDPIPEPVAFDTVLQMGSGAFEIKER